MCVGEEERQDRTLIRLLVSLACSVGTLQDQNDPERAARRVDEPASDWTIPSQRSAQRGWEKRGGRRWTGRGHRASIEVTGDREEARPLPARLAFVVSQQSAQAQLENIQWGTCDFITTQTFFRRIFRRCSFLFVGIYKHSDVMFSLSESCNKLFSVAALTYL